MNLFRSFGLGFKAYGKAIEIIFKKKLWWFFVFPLALNILFLVIGFYGVTSLTDFVTNWFEGFIEIEKETFLGSTYLRDLLNGASGFTGGIIWVLFRILFFFIFATFGGYIVIVCLSPIFAILSEKTEEILTGNKYQFNANQFIRDIIRGILIAIRNVLIEFAYILLFLVLSFIPLIGQLSAVILFFISAYFYGFSFVDYTNERRKLTIGESVSFMRKNKGMVIANGILFSFIMYIPLIGVTLSGFVAIISVVAATISAHDIVDLSTNQFAKK